MSLLSTLKRLLTRPERARDRPRVAYPSPRAAVLAFLHDPQWGARVVEQSEERIVFEYDGVTGEWLDDPTGDWLHLRFRDPFTEAQQSSELAMYEGWAAHCAQHTLFRWDIDEQAQEYYGDAFALFHEQYNQLECIWGAFNSAKLLREGSNRIAMGRSFDLFFGDRGAGNSVAGSLWRWFDSPAAPKGTRHLKGTYREEWFDTGSAVCSVMQEQWAYYARIAYTNGDFQPYMSGGEEQQLRLYRLHLGLQRWFPRLRNFVIQTDNPENSGANETSVAILVSSGTDAGPIFDRVFREFYGQVIEITEWFNFDFNPKTAPWFDHSIKKPQRRDQRQSPVRGIPDAKENR
ncbi:hypothetical protein CBQ26_16500 [Deinococcus indicus]|uniref:Uncharacterized protein n=1 Tax=Deinococcus indicus TaxID=223556 RepID=A0A246BGX7_9DEIO|nr:hypothetical protein [Deinococcus indicus]OWL94440.1 hypothetical protein CBQ26_16500 [Deinococcus indicus]GHG41839.1 hypothetical protein GCM10017784_40890 [Deinococcus indicus]